MIKIEEPNSDAIRLFNTTKEVEGFLSNHGNPETILVRGVITVPAFAAGREAYMEMKAADCARYGSN